ncbi:condensation domain-containing protein [Streptomyces pluripotens]|uniref:condensation domain-containing protein n=1 Tax=Streptomyces pluripotens TaxID=1355015 RepID=UPI000B10263E|nr:condensation domain-containing protein [Streptomyces pluripotens]
MSNPFEDADALYRVLVNSEGQYSLWPADIAVPAGWATAHDADSRKNCLEYVEAQWADMRPDSLVQAQRTRKADDASARRPLSANEEFMCAFDRGDDLGVFGPRGIVLAGWRVRGQLDVATVQLALDDVVARHEALRTTIIRDKDAPYARVSPPSPVALTVVDLPSAAGEADRECLAHEFLDEVDRHGRLGSTELPLLRATLARFDEDDAVFVLVTNHLASDGWSMHVLMRDFAICYATRRGLPAPELPVTRQLGEYAHWQQEVRNSESAAIAREYWQDTLSGGEMLILPTDRPRRLDVPPVYSVYRFVLDQELAGAATALAKSLHSSPFMVLFACFNLFLHRRTGVTDIVSPVITSGRTEPGFEDTVGTLFNFLPIRTDVSGCASFADLVRRTRASLLEAYSYELPFGEIIAKSEPELMAGPIMNVSSVVSAFQISQFPPETGADDIGGLRFSALRRRLKSLVDVSEIPDGNLWELDLHPDGDVVGVVKYNSLDFDLPTIAAMVDEYRELLLASLKSPDAALPK